MDFYPSNTLLWLCKNPAQAHRSCHGVFPQDPPADSHSHCLMVSWGLLCLMPAPYHPHSGAQRWWKNG